MAVSKLSDIIPTKTLLVDEVRPPNKFKRKKASTSKITPVPRGAPGQYKHPQMIDRRVWLQKFGQFLEFCGWQKSSDERYYHPNGKLYWDGEDFFDEDINDYVNNLEISRETADEWVADDVNFTLTRHKSIGEGKAASTYVVRLK